MPRTYSYTGDSCPKVSLRAPLPHVVITDINGLLVQQSSRPATCVKGCDALRHRRIRDFAKPLRYVVSHFFPACQNHRSGITQCLAPESKGLNFRFADYSRSIHGASDARHSSAKRSCVPSGSGAFSGATHSRGEPAASSKRATST